MEYGDLILYFTIGALGASVLVIIGLALFLVKKSMGGPSSSD